MKPAEFAEVVVFPTVREHLANRGDRRRAYLACIVTYSLIDYLGLVEGGKEAVRERLREQCDPSYKVVQGICNGTKHAGSTSAFRFVPGSEVEVPAIAYGVGFYGHGRYGGMPGLEVIHEESKLFIDFCVQALLRTLMIAYPDHLTHAEFAWFDALFWPDFPKPF